MGASSNKIKKVFQFQRSATVLILFFATILASFFGGIKLFSYSGKVLYTQVRLIQCYTEIKGLEDTREYNLNMLILILLEARITSVMQRKLMKKLNIGILFVLVMSIVMTLSLPRLPRMVLSSIFS